MRPVQFWFGLLVGMAMATTCNANLVVNGQFSTGDLTGWNQPVDPSIVIDQLAAPPGDLYDAAFTGDGILSQDIGTMPDQSYLVSFSLLDEAGFFLDTFTVNFGGWSRQISGDTAANWQVESTRIDHHRRRYIAQLPGVNRIRAKLEP